MKRRQPTRAASHDWVSNYSSTEERAARSLGDSPPSDCALSAGGGHDADALPCPTTGRRPHDAARLAPGARVFAGTRRAGTGAAASFVAEVSLCLRRLRGSGGVSQGRFSVAQFSSLSQTQATFPLCTPAAPAAVLLGGSFQGSASHLTAVLGPEHRLPSVSLPPALEAVCRPAAPGLLSAFTPWTVITMASHRWMCKCSLTKAPRGIRQNQMKSQPFLVLST